jgi:hypothetical protein
VLEPPVILWPANRGAIRISAADWAVVQDISGGPDELTCVVHDVDTGMAYGVHSTECNVPRCRCLAVAEPIQ